MSHPPSRWLRLPVNLLVVVGALLLSGALIGAVGEAERVPTIADSLPDRADSTVAATLAEGLPAGDDPVAIVLFTAPDGEIGGEQRRAVETLVADLGAGEDRQGPPLQVSEDRTAALAVIPLDSDEGDQAGAVAELRAALADQVPEGLEAAVTGPAAIQADLAEVFDGADVTLLAATATVVAVLLLITYRSPLLWLVPLIVVALADRVAVVVATHALDGVGLPWDGSTTGILSVLVFGAGTDYALLLISRYRDELRQEEDRRAAMTTAWRGTAEAVLSSSTTVVIGLLTLLLSLVPTTRGLGLACAMGVVVAATYALVVLPSALVLCPRWIFWPLVPRVGQAPLADSRTSWWRRLGEHVAARPATFAVGAVLLLGVLASGLTQVRVGLAPSDQFLDTPESIAAADRLAESFPAGTSEPAVVITRADAEEVARVAAQSPGVASARPATSADGLSRIDVVLSAEPGSDGSEAAVERLRDSLADFDQTWVGGTQAEQIDDDAAASRDRLLIVPSILVMVLVALVLLLRSLVAPLLLVVTVVATYAAALGASWWIYTAVFGFPAMDATVPLYAFLFLVALGVDYNIFLVTRAAQETCTHGLREGMLRALTATGGVITSAGVLLAAVFAVLGVLPLVVLAQIGIVICVGVLLDTLLVRTVLVPALALRLEEGFWWPRRFAPAAGVASSGAGEAQARERASR